MSWFNLAFVVLYQSFTSSASQLGLKNIQSSSPVTPKLTSVFPTCVVLIKRNLLEKQVYLWVWFLTLFSALLGVKREELLLHKGNVDPYTQINSFLKVYPEATSTDGKAVWEQKQFSNYAKLLWARRGCVSECFSNATAQRSQGPSSLLFVNIRFHKAECYSCFFFTKQITVIKLWRKNFFSAYYYFSGVLIKCSEMLHVHLLNGSFTFSSLYLFRFVRFAIWWASLILNCCL